MTRSFDGFRRDSSGGVMLIFALALPVLLAFSAMAIEYASLSKRRTELQRAADSGAIAGVNQFKLANAEDSAAVTTAVEMARAQARSTGGQATTVTAEVLGNHAAVQVLVSEQVPLTLGKLVNTPTVAVAVQSTAKLAGTTRLCLLALDPAARGAFHLESGARISAKDCSLYSNSKSAEGIQGENASYATALSTCSAGGYRGSSANFLPVPATGCPVLRDPLIDRPEPTAGPCVSLSFLLNPKMLLDGLDNLLYGANVVSGVATLDPGTYCGGLHITKGARVNLRPGIYIMKDGPLVVDKNASLTGVNTGFFFTGPRGGLLFDEKSVISLTAPKDGLLAGLLFFEERNLSLSLPLPPLLPLSGKGLVPLPPGGLLNMREYRIISDEARTLLGTIYLPMGRLVIDSKKPIADQSAYTVIIARLINLYDGPNLVLNARYGGTDIPVPKGVGPSSSDTVLSQ